MATVVAEINGRKLYSDKPVRGITNTRVTFLDGSWCDVSTGKIHNKGGGYISFDAPPAGETGPQKTKIGPTNYSGNMVSLKDLSEAKIHVEPFDGSQIEVTIEGRSDAVKNIEVFQNGSTVVISGKNQRGGGINIVSGRGNSSIRVGNVTIGGNISGSSINIGGTVISGGNIISGKNVSISINGDDSETLVCVKVPRKTTVLLFGDYVSAHIGDTEGPVEITTSGTGDTRVGSISNLTVRASGTGDVSVSRVNGNVSLDVSGVGKVRIRDGVVETLHVNVSGVGDANLQVVATNATLFLTGVGDIYVKQVINPPNTREKGIGDIEIGKIGR